MKRINKNPFFLFNFLRYAPSNKEPGYHAPASVDEIYFGSSKSVNPNSHYQPISEIRNSRYTPLYQPLSGKSILKKLLLILFYYYINISHVFRIHKSQYIIIAI